MYIGTIEKRFTVKLLMMVCIDFRVRGASQPAAAVVSEADPGLQGSGCDRPYDLLEERPGSVRPHSPPAAGSHVREITHKLAIIQSHVHTLIRFDKCSIIWRLFDLTHVVVPPSLSHQNKLFACTKEQ